MQVRNVPGAGRRIENFVTQNPGAAVSAANEHETKPETAGAVLRTGRRPAAPISTKQAQPK